MKPEARPTTKETRKLGDVPDDSTGLDGYLPCLHLPGSRASHENYPSARVERRTSGYRACSAGRFPSVRPVLARSARRE